MRSQRYLLAPVLAMMAGLTAPMAMAENRIDTQLPNAPDMAAYGNMGVGVRQIDLVNTDQIDILAIDPKAPKPEIEYLLYPSSMLISTVLIKLPLFENKSAATLDPATELPITHEKLSALKSNKIDNGP